MRLKTSYDQEFVDLMFYLTDKYGQKMLDLDGIGKQTDMCQFSKDFFSASTTADASVDANANVSDTSNIAYGIELPKPFFKINSYFMLWKQMKKLYGSSVANSTIERQLNGAIYVNDVIGIAAGSPYCFNYSTYDILLLGLPMVDKIKSAPPKYLYSFKSQLEQFTIIAANSTLGATGLADMLIVMSYYVAQALKTKSDAGFKFADEESVWKYVTETLVSFLYTINQPSRGNQSCFTNVSIYDRPFLESLCPSYVFPDGSTADIELVQKIQDVFLTVMNEEMRRTPVTFPVTTACFVIDDNKEIVDKGFAKYIAEKNSEYGFINFYMGKSSTLSSCCRLRSDTDNEYFNSFGSGSSKIGSLGVVAVNLPRLAFRNAGNEDTFFEELKDLVGNAARVNHAKRTIIRNRIENGNLPLYSLGFMELSKQYSTTGVNGINECCEIMGYDILTEQGQEFVVKMLQTINAENDKYQKQYKTAHNTEQIPGENVSIKLADKDRLLGYNNKYDIYSNQFIPLTTKADLLDRIKLQGLFDSHFTGGAICHLNLEERVEDSSKVVALLEHCAKSGVVYFALNYSIQRCEQGHMTVGRKEVCDVCGSKITDTFSRVVGFLTSIANWHRTRREQDWPNREFYREIER